MTTHHHHITQPFDNNHFNPSFSPALQETLRFPPYNLEDVDDYETLIPKDIEQAKKWWQKAAAQGNQKAKDLLQQVY